MRWLDGFTDSMDLNLNKLQRQWRTEEPGVLQSMGLKRVGHNLATEQQNPKYKDTGVWAKGILVDSPGEEVALRGGVSFLGLS